MQDQHGEPVEISTRMRPGEWTQERLSELVGSYQCKLAAMGASDAEILTEVEPRDDGSVLVRVSWQHAGVHTFADLTQGVRAHGEATDDSLLGFPPTARAREAEKHQQIPDAIIVTTDDGDTHVEDLQGWIVRPPRHI